MPTKHKLLAALVTVILGLSLATPAYAFDGRSGETVTIAQGEVVNDDLYIGATEVILDGTVNGDVISGSKMITVNGKIDGNLIAAAQQVVVNGTITGDVMAAGSVLYFGKSAQIGGDVVGAGYSVELATGTIVGRDAVLGAYQVLMAGSIGRNLLAGSGGLEIDGSVGGNARVSAGDPDQSQSQPPPGLFLSDITIPVPVVKPGLTIDPAAHIKGNLNYVRSADLTFPAGVVVGTITRQAPPPEETEPAVLATPAQKAGIWGLDLLRTLITLILLGMLLLWIFPGFLGALTTQLESKPWPSLGLGVLTIAAAAFLVLMALFTAILGAVIFGVLTLGGLSAAIVWIGLLFIFALVLGLVLAASFLSKIIVGAAIGRWILARTRPSLVEHRYWPLLIGVTVVVLVVGLLSFPLIPGALGWLLNLLVVLFGLGALWLWGRDLFVRQPAAAG